MTAAVFRSGPRPRRIGMKILTAVLTAVCAIELLIAFEQVRPPSEWRLAPTPTLPEITVPTWAPGPRVLDFRDRIGEALWPEPVWLADAADAPLAGRFVAITPEADFDGAVFEGATIRLGDQAWRTRPWRIAAGRDGAVEGWTFARRLAAAADAQIELRQIVPTEDDATVAASPLCGGGAPGTAALLHRQDQVDLILFRAGATPGPDAPPSALCGVWTLRRE